AIAGAPMSTSYLRWHHTSSHDRVAADFAAASAWLAEFQSDTAAEPAPLDLGAGVAGRLRERFAGDDRLGADLSRLDRIHERLRAHLLSGPPVHGALSLGQ